MQVLFLTKYDRMGASSRYRSLQYFPLLEAEGIRCVAAPLLNDTYLRRRYASGQGSLVDLIKAFLGRLRVLITASRYDLIVIEYELLPFIPAFFERLLAFAGVPFVAEYDDALFHRYDQHSNPLIRGVLSHKIAVVMRQARLVIAGNEYLADYARQAGAMRVEVLPTVVDLERYPERPCPDNDCFTIGWIGSPSTSKYLEAIAPALAEVCAGGRAKVVLIGAGQVRLPGVPVEIIPWLAEREVADMHLFDVGIMPLTDNPWDRGKCGFKLIQYMACGLPVVASPVGVNKEIVEQGVNGFLAENTVKWVEAITRLRDDPDLRKRMGTDGRCKVEEKYCLQVTGSRYADLIRSVIKNNGKAD